MENAFIGFMNDKNVPITKLNICSSKVISAKDSRATSEEILAARKNKIDGLMHLKTLKIVEKDISAEANYIQVDLYQQLRLMVGMKNARLDLL